jgi:sugar/nucleoside kinase (ribokinase family)
MEPIHRAVVAGHICLDIIPDLTNVPHGKFLELFQPGLMLQIGAPIFSTGGPVSNTGLALHILGIKTQLTGKIGQDLYGRAIYDFLSQKDQNLVKGLKIDPGVTTSYTIIISPPGTDRMFLHHPGANDTFGVEDINFTELERFSLFHFGYPPVMRKMYQEEGRELAEIFSNAQSTGITTSLDLCFPDPESEGGKADWKKILSRTLPYVDIFSPSVEELLFALQKDKYFELFSRGGSRFLQLVTPELLAEITQEVLDMGVKIALVKLGDRGAYLRTAGLVELKNIKVIPLEHISLWAKQELWAPCFEVKVVGTTGSGDATIAGFLSSFLRRGTPAQALTTAVAVGACNVEALDAISGLQAWEATQERIEAGWRRLPLELHSPGWEWDSEKILWHGPAK